MADNNAFFMLATDETGSVAVMPIIAENIDEAEEIARDWLVMYKHDFARAILSFRDSQEIYAMTVQEILTLVWNNPTSLLD